MHVPQKRAAVLGDMHQNKDFKARRLNPFQRDAL